MLFEEISKDTLKITASDLIDVLGPESNLRAFRFWCEDYAENNRVVPLVGKDNFCLFPSHFSNLQTESVKNEN